MEKRNSSVELLRILSMIMIITLHYLSKGGLLSGVERFSFNYFVVWVVEAFCCVAVNCYVLISGYFLLESKFKVKRLINLWLQVLFYSIFIYIILRFFKIIPFDLKSSLTSFFPVLLSQYWFVSAYIPLYILSPFINILLKSLNKKQMQILLLIDILFFSIWPMIPGGGANTGQGYGLVWFICLYCFAAYIRLYYKNQLNPHIYIIFYCGLSILIFISRIILEYILPIIGIYKGFDRFYQYNSLLVLMSSIFLFLYFINKGVLGESISKFITGISGLTFGVYLIHENANFQTILWDKIIKPYQYLNSSFIILHILIGVILIFISCIFIDYLRKKLFYLISKLCSIFKSSQ